MSTHSFYLNLCFSGTFCPIFGSKLGQNRVKCTGFTIKPVYRIDPYFIEIYIYKLKKHRENLNLKHD